MPQERPEDDLPSMEVFTHEVYVGRAVLRSLPQLYRDATDAGAWPLGGAGVHVNGGSTPDATEEAVENGLMEKQRDQCRAAVAWMRLALEAATNARLALKGEYMPQPEMLDPRASITVPEWVKRRHVKREEELRKR